MMGFSVEKKSKNISCSCLLIVSMTLLYPALSYADDGPSITYAGSLTPAPKAGVTDWYEGAVGLSERTGKTTAFLTISGGATANLFSLRQYIGDSTVTIDGAGSSLILRSELVVGSGDGNTSLTVSNGAFLSSSTSVIGNAGGSTARVLVTGNNSLWQNSGQITIGSSDRGELIVSDGAHVDAKSVRVGGGGVGRNIGGTLTVTGNGSVLNAPQFMHVGVENDGVVNISDGGSINTDTLSIGSSKDITGAVNIGAASGEAPQRTGTLNANKIVFSSGSTITGSLNLNHLDSTVIGAVISGKGDINQQAGTTVFTGDSPDFTGNVNITGGALQLGNGVVSGNLGSASNYSVGAQGLLDLGGFDASIQSLSNAGEVSFGGLGANTLTVSGNYAGSGGLLVFNSILGNDDARTDKLVVLGDTSGTTRVDVNNLGGSGAKTLHGMELISVGGNSAGEFTQQGRIAAGAYDYRLLRGAGADASNWYLSSTLTTPAPVDPGPSPLPQGVQVLRPEAGAYIGNFAAANSMFTTNLNDRLGETEYTDMVTGEQKLTSLWMRTGGGRNRSEDSSGQLKMKANRYSVMLGGDLAAGSSSNGSTWRLGGLAGYGNDHNTTTSDITGYRAKGEVDGYTTGLYGTWYANGTDEAGLYADTVLQYSWFNNTVKGDDLANESYKSKGLSASLESGYVFDIGSHAGSSYFLQPKAQLAWSGIRADNYTEQNGTRVTANGNDNVRSSLGVKAFMKGYTAQGDGKQQSFKPYVETNWIHNTEDYGVKMDGVDVSQEGSRNIAEFRVGVEGHVMPQLNITTSLTRQVGSNGWSDTTGMLGLKYFF